MKDASVRRWSRFHARLYRLTNGVIGRRLVNNDMLLLTTTGRTSGRQHTVPLLYLDGGDALVVIASYGGRPQNPDWFENLIVEPQVAVEVRSSSFSAVARTASATERAEWWPRIEAAYDGYEVYQSRTSREIPVVLLEPIDEG